MQEENRQDEEKKTFIREKIKEKPIGTKRLLRGAGIAVCFGILFGAAAFFTYFALSKTVMKPSASTEETVSVSISLDDVPVFLDNGAASGDVPSASADAVGESGEDTDDGAQTDTTSGGEIAAMSTEEYQALQSALYQIGIEANPSIVTVSGVTSASDLFDTNYEREGTAAGVILGDNNVHLLILTQKHVVEDAGEIRVTFIDDEVLTAYLVATDEITGLAVVAVPLAQITEDTKEVIEVATLGNSYLCRQGDLVLALGSPLGGIYSVLVGDLIATDNEISVEDGAYRLLATDMVGSSDGSGVLINLSGEVIGIILPSLVKEEDTNTITAVAISELKPLIERLLNGEQMAYLGVNVSTVTDALADKYDLPYGAYVTAIHADSPAFEGGLQEGDVITAFGSTEITSVTDLQRYLQNHNVGETVSVTVMRLANTEYKEITLEVTLASLP